MSRIGRRRLYDSVLLELKPRPPPQEEFGFVPEVTPKRKRGPKPWTPLRQIPTNVDPQRVVSIALRNGNAIANGHADQVCEKNGRKRFSRQRKDANTKIVGDMASWKKLFDERRGFVSQKDAHSRTSTNKETGRKRYHKGFDEAARALWDGGLTGSQTQKLQLQIISGYVEQIKKLELRFRYFDEWSNEVRMGYRFAWNAANRFYYEVVRPDIRPMMLEASALNPRLNWFRIEKNLKFMVYLGIRREMSHRIARVRAEEEKKKRESWEDKMDRVTLNREDVRDLVENGVPLEYIRATLERPSPKVTHSFYDTLKRAEVKPEEKKAVVPEEPVIVQEESKGWMSGVSAFVLRVRAFFKAWFS
jgi:hypothetical protein